MKSIVFLLSISSFLCADWSSAYGYGDDILMPNKNFNYNKEFLKSAEEKISRDESMKNLISPMVSEDSLKREKKDNSYDKNTKDFFYSTNKRLYYEDGVKNHKKFPTTDY